LKFDLISVPFYDCSFLVLNHRGFIFVEKLVSVWNFCESVLLLSTSELLAEGDLHIIVFGRKSWSRKDAFLLSIN